jgi:hypothetical protein
MSRTVTPTTETITRLTTLMLSSFQRLKKRLIEERLSIFLSDCASDIS